MLAVLELQCKFSGQYRDHIFQPLQLFIEAS